MYDDYLNNVWYYLDKDDKNHDWENFHDQKYIWHMKDKNQLNDLEKKAHKSFDDCRKACESLDECLQFRWQDDACAMSKNFRLGNPMRKEDEPSKRWMSGWDVEKINKWIDAQDECVPSFPEQR